ncbi:MAG TPA: hypothetical protein VNU27_12495 [Candidatus Acidoferrum sp.]|nr:hypothetical protein [Candidatus Acidoferrum sp.]
MSRRDAVLVAIVIAVWTGVLISYVGPTYIRPLPMWGQILLAVACGLIVATIAIDSRRRSRRKTSSP